MLKTRTSHLLTTLVALSAVAFAGTVPGSAAFTVTPLLRPDGGSENAISIAANGTMGLTTLSWENFVTHYWSGPFGATPAFRGEIDSALQLPGRRLVFGGGDADVDIGSSGTLHASTLIFLTPPTLRSFTLGVSAITCPSALQAVPVGCKSQIIDKAGADRQWITSDGSRVWISYHDAGNSTLIRVQRSDDDGLTWKKVGGPIPGQGAATGDATFNNDQGPLVADSFTHNLYAVYAAGQPGIQKATSASFNNIFVSRSTDGGKSWTANLVFHAPLFTALNNIFPALAVDPTDGTLYAAWSDGRTVSLSKSTDQAVTWSEPLAVNIAPAATAIFPWVAAYNGTLAVTYYGTTASSHNNPSAVWHTYVALSSDGQSFAQSVVNTSPNHVGVICTGGTSCAPGTRNLLDLFEIAFDPQNSKVAVVYTDDTLATDSQGNPLPQAILAQQN